MVPPDSWIPGLLEEASVMRGEAAFIHTLPLTPGSLRELSLSFAAPAPGTPALPDDMLAALRYATRINGLNPQLIQRPLSDFFASNVTIDEGRSWNLFFGGNATIEA